MNLTFQNMDSGKKDKIINAAIKEFAMYPYEKASTNNIVKNAGISKGLLFHYFGNKKDLYEKLIEFVLNKLSNEIAAKIDWQESDIFERIKAMFILKMKISHIYPNMFDFIAKVLSQKNTSTVAEISNVYKKYGVDIQGVFGDIYTKNIDFSLFKNPSTIDKSINIIRWTMEKYTEENFLKSESLKIIDYEEISAELDIYISILKKTFYK